MTHLPRHIRPILALLALSPVLPSCSGTFHRPKVLAPEGLNGRELLVVPFSEGRTRKRWHGESDRGLQVAEACKQWARDNAEDPYFAEGQTVRQILTHVKEWTKDRISPKDWQQLTAGHGVRYVLVGDVLAVNLTSPGAIGIYDAVAKASYELVDVRTGRVILDAEPVVRWGNESTPQVSFSSRFNRDPEVEAMLLRRLGERIAKDLYGYYGD